MFLSTALNSMRSTNLAQLVIPNQQQQLLQLLGHRFPSRSFALVIMVIWFILATGSITDTVVNIGIDTSSSPTSLPMNVTVRFGCGLETAVQVHAVRFLRWFLRFGSGFPAVP